MHNTVAMTRVTEITRVIQKKNTRIKLTLVMDKCRSMTLRSMTQRAPKSTWWPI